MNPPSINLCVSSELAQAWVHSRWVALVHASHTSTPSFRAVRTVLKAPVHTLLDPMSTCTRDAGWGGVPTLNEASQQRATRHNGEKKGVGPHVE